MLNRYDAKRISTKTEYTSNPVHATEKGKGSGVISHLGRMQTLPYLATLKGSN